MRFIAVGHQDKKVVVPIEAALPALELRDGLPGEGHAGADTAKRSRLPAASCAWSSTPSLARLSKK